MLEKCKNKQTHLYTTIKFPSYERTVNHYSVDHDIYRYIYIYTYIYVYCVYIYMYTVCIYIYVYICILYICICIWPSAHQCHQPTLWIATLPGYHVYLAELLLFTAQSRGPSVKSATRTVGPLYSKISVPNPQDPKTRCLTSETERTQNPKKQKKIEIAGRNEVMFPKAGHNHPIIIPQSSHFPMNDSYELAQYQVLSLCSQVIVGGVIR